MGLQASYDGDVVAWANEQARLLRAGRFSELDLDHIADEVEDVGISEQRQLASRMAVLLAHLLKWKFQPAFQCRSWLNTINTQRQLIKRHVAKMPSLKSTLSDSDWFAIMWGDGCLLAQKETGLDFFPESSLWDLDQVLQDGFLPE